MIYLIFRSISRNIRRYLKPLRDSSNRSSLIIKKTHSHQLEKKATNINHQLVLNGSSWHDIPDDIMETIVQKLSVGDRVRMGAVCKSWRAILARVRVAAHKAPWLMLPYKPWCESMSFYSLSEDRIYSFEMPKLNPLGRGGWCCGCSRGWLVMVAGLDYDPDMFLLNPISGARIKLPPLKPVPYFQNFMETIECDDDVSSFIQRVEIFSASSSEDGMVVAAVFGVEFDQVLAFCRPQEDLEWTTFAEIGNLHYGDILFHKDILYALVYAEEESDAMVTGQTHTIGLTDCSVQLGLIHFKCGDQSLEYNDDNDGDGELLSGVEVYPDFTNFTGIVEDDYPFMVESTNGELLVVLRIIDMLSADTHVNDDDEEEEFDLEYCQTREFIISTEKGRKFTCLGDQALFLGSTGSFSLPTEDSNGINGNCIYFAGLHQNSSVYDHESYTVSRESGIFNLEDGKIKRCFPSVRLPMPSKGGWFIPRI